MIICICDIVINIMGFNLGLISLIVYLILVKRSRPRVPFGPDWGTGVPVSVVL